MFSYVMVQLCSYLCGANSAYKVRNYYGLRFSTTPRLMIILFVSTSIVERRLFFNEHF